MKTETSIARLQEISCRLALCCAAALLALCALAVAPAGAAVPPSFLTQFPPNLTWGSGAGQMAGPNAVAVDPTTHHIFVVDEAPGVLSNERIDEFTAWGEFVKAFGWGVATGAAELQTCTAACQAGIGGSGPGQFEQPNGLAFDAAGNLYVFERLNHRVQKFDPTAGLGGGAVEYLLQFGGEGTGPGQFSIENLEGVTLNYIAVGPTGTVFVADKGRIQAFEPDGTYIDEVPLPEPGNPGALAVDPVDGSLYFAFNQWLNSNQPKVYKLDPATGKVLRELEPRADASDHEVHDKPVALAVDAEQNLYVVDRPQGSAEQHARVMKFGPSGSFVVEFDEITGEEIGSEGFRIDEPGVATAVVGTDSSEVDIYVLHSRFPDIAAVRVYGAVPDPAVVGPPPLKPPTISDQYASKVTPSAAVLAAKINPHFWNDTRYFLEYGTGKCSEGGCPLQQPVAPGALLSERIIDAALTTPNILLTGLASGTTYHYRFVAESSGSEGNPVRGVGGKVGVDGSEATFTTRGLPLPPETDCANQAFRTGAGSALPDCRAYEMVSPVDKGNANVVALGGTRTGSSERVARVDQAAVSGDQVTYSAYKAFGDAISSPYSSQYMATRGESGWSNHSISPPRQGPTLLTTTGLDVQFKYFTLDLCAGTLLQDTALSLAPGSVPGYANLYRDDLCGTAGYTPATTLAPPTGELKPNQMLIDVQGASANAKCTVFRVNAKLSSKAIGGQVQQVYRSCNGGAPVLVCVKPGGSAAGTCSVGSLNGSEPSLIGAVSADGTKVFWSAAGTKVLYLFSGGSESVALSAGPAHFLAASADGSRALFSEGAQLFEYAGAGKKLIAAGFDGLLGTSQDAKVAYFLSSEELDAGATAGKPNLYRYEAGEPSGSFHFVATLATADAVTEPLTGGYTPVAFEPFFHSARVTPDGGVLAFSSFAPLTGADNNDVVTGKPAAEVFVYDAASDHLVCVSCDSSGARPQGRNLRTESAPFFAAAVIPGAASPLHDSTALSENGGRLFFNAYAAVVSSDTNGAEDVYEWEAQGEGSCQSPDGCTRLISSGEDPQDSEFIDADPTGANVFFTTGQSLVGQDLGLIDVYDARVGGGFPAPTPSSECEGETCQQPSTPPDPVSPASAGYEGPGNVKESSPKRCGKGKHKVKKNGRTRCVKNKPKHGKSGRSAR